VDTSRLAPNVPHLSDIGASPVLEAITDYQVLSLGTAGVIQLSAIHHSDTNMGLSDIDVPDWFG
jgi:hypothetical protein